MSTIEKVNNVYQTRKKSGWLKIFFGIVFLVIAIPLLIFGFAQASYNGIVWTTKGKERKLAKLTRKETTLELEQNILTKEANIAKLKENKKIGN